MQRSTILLVLLALVTLCVVIGMITSTGLGPRQKDDLSNPRIYAYRDWQSTGIQFAPGTRLAIRAWGT